jgi:hypothetical protein
MPDPTHPERSAPLLKWSVVVIVIALLGWVAVVLLSERPEDLVERPPLPLHTAGEDAAVEPGPDPEQHPAPELAARPPETPNSAGAEDAEPVPDPAAQPQEPDSQSLTDNVSLSVRELLEQEDDQESMQAMFELLEAKPDRARLDRMVMALMDSKSQHETRLAELTRQPLDRDDPDALSERRRLAGELDQQYRREQRESLRLYLTPTDYQTVLENWDSVAGDGEDA